MDFKGKHGGSADLLKYRNQPCGSLAALLAALNNACLPPAAQVYGFSYAGLRCGLGGLVTVSSGSYHVSLRGAHLPQLRSHIKVPHKQPPLQVRWRRGGGGWGAACLGIWRLMSSACEQPPEQLPLVPRARAGCAAAPPPFSNFQGACRPPGHTRGTCLGGQSPALVALAVWPPIAGRRWVHILRQHPWPSAQWGPQLGPSTGQAVHLLQHSQRQVLPSQPVVGLKSHRRAAWASPAPPALPCESGLSHQWGPQLGPIHRPMPRMAALGTPARATCGRLPSASATWAL